MTDDDYTQSYFTANLKLASSYYRSISEVCRRLGINRQQFMKYLSGSSFPSRHNLRRIADFFGFDEYEILMPPDQFRKILSLRPKHENEELTLPPLLPDLFLQAQRQRGTLTKIHGYYYEYCYSFSTAKHILRSLVFFYGWKDYTLYKRIERLRRPGAGGPPDVYKYSGIVTVVGGRIHMLDQETITGSELTQSILFLNYRNRVSLLTGLKMGVSGSDAHEPSAARVMLEYIGSSVDLRQAIAACQLYPEQSSEIPAQIRDGLSDNGRITGPLRAAML
ncbi:MAG: helix-turn-helix transcriptional regulator [Gammaproteobacteria bacterium]|nr:helix-turn-helix transcriptional regulator [Gammaproteobacteria bacterium]